MQKCIMVKIREAKKFRLSNLRKREQKKFCCVFKFSCAWLVLGFLLWRSDSCTSWRSCVTRSRRNIQRTASSAFSWEWNSSGSRSVWRLLLHCSSERRLWRSLCNTLCTYITIVLYCIYTFIKRFLQHTPIRSASSAQDPERREQSWENKKRHNASLVVP